MLQKLILLISKIELNLTRGKKVKIQGYKKAIITLKKGQSIDLDNRNLNNMALKTFKPYTKSTRGTVLVDRTGLWKGKPFKTLVKL